MTQLDLGGVRIEHRLDGRSGSDVVMLSNSLASSLGMWDTQVPALVAAGWSVLRYDHRGHGGSSVPPGDYTIAALAGDALRLLDRLGIERVHFCGLSMGGMVGQWLGVHHGDRLHSLVLCDTAAQVAPPDVWDQRIATVREGGMQAVADATIDRWFTAAGQQRLGAEVEKIRAMILATPTDGFCGCCAAIREMDQRESLASITTPTLIVVGEEDPGTPVAAAEVIHAGIAGSRLEVIEAAAHLVNIEQSGEFDRLLLEFLDARR